MPSVSLLGAPDRILRTSEAYRLVLFDRMADVERRRLDGLCRNPGFYGVLSPADGGTQRPVDRDTALLLLTLREPGPVPSFYVRESGDLSWRRQLVSMLLDGVLEVHDGEEFVSGEAALPMIPQLGSLGSGGEIDQLADLSRRAVRWAATWARENVRQEGHRALARRLYDYHRLPLTPVWSERLGRPGDLERYLDIPSGPTGWRRRPRQASDDWIVFERRVAGGPGPGPFKLYVSPRPEGLSECIRALFSLADDCRIGAIKIAGLAGDVLRPDKLMVYTDRLEALFEIGERLLAQVDGVVPHGVPFSAEIGGGGLLSWGVDRRRRPGAQSWRAWLIERVAQSLETSLAKDGSASRPLWQRALGRLRLDGIDVESWRPNAELWRPVG